MESCTKVLLNNKKKESTAQNDNFRILFSPETKRILRFYKRLYIFLDEVYNYETQLIDERVRNELKTDWKNGTLTFSKRAI